MLVSKYTRFGKWMMNSYIFDMNNVPTYLFYPLFCFNYPGGIPNIITADQLTKSDLLVLTVESEYFSLCTVFL